MNIMYNGFKTAKQETEKKALIGLWYPWKPPWLKASAPGRPDACGM